ncbi:MAG: 1-deoxy-D-xylulose-5-phosphate reductoisomerase [Planctomycetia bacterium]|nr:1-deoxy-D-xylulose-5-phosphate reductoisomerase [Planctomycetia bacterium]
MLQRPTRVALMGSTGSIGCRTLEVIQSLPESLRAAVLSAHTSLDLLAEQAQRVRPRRVVATEPEAAKARSWNDLPPGTELLIGEEGVIRAVTDPEIDVVVAAIVGSAGLRGAWAALECGKTLALANKETLVMAGALMTEQARRSGASLVPIDSEHSALFQCLQAGRREEVKRVILTASGGPFRRHSLEQLQRVTVEEALAHPTWSMGRKITIDSATMMNKALEIVEARWLFDLQPEQIEVVIHPQSVVHSLVEFVDGSVVAQMSPPDMRLPIQYALTYPRRMQSIAERLDWAQALRLDFEPPDYERFPALELGQEVAKSGGTAGAVVNAANEAAVGGFLAGELAFTDIVPACRAALSNHEFDPHPALDDLIRLDRWAREEVARWVCT